jgi:hypothetical protein
VVKKQRIRRASAEEIEAMRARGESRSDWRAAEAVASADIERLADDEDGALRAWLGKHCRCRAAGSAAADPYPAGPRGAALSQGAWPGLSDADQRGAAGAAAGGTGGVVETQEARGLLARFLDSHLINEISAGVRFTWGQCPGQGNDADVERILWYRHSDVLAGSSAAPLPRPLRVARSAD